MAHWRSGLLLGPGLGALVAAAIGGIANASGEYFSFYLATSAAYGYLVTLPAFLPVMLLAVSAPGRFDAVCALGFAWVCFYELVFGAPILSGESFPSP